MRPAARGGEQFVAFDIETTGLRAELDRIIQIGATRFTTGGKVISRFETFVDPSVPIPRFVQELCHITSADVAGAPCEKDAVAALARFCEGATLIGHSGNFDKAFCSRSQPLAFGKSRFLYDTHTLSRLLVNTPHYSLVALAKQFNIRHTQPHRAPSDAEATGKLFFALVALAVRAPSEQFSNWMQKTIPGSMERRFLTEVALPRRQLGKAPQCRSGSPRVGRIRRVSAMEGPFSF